MSRPEILRSLSTLVVAWFLATAPGYGEEYVWKNPPPQGSVFYQYYWGTTNYWDPAGIPTAVDSAQIPDGMCQVVDRVEVNSLTVTGATLFGPGPVVVQHLIAGGAQLADASDLNYTNYPTGDHAIEMHESAEFSGTVSVRLKMKNFGEALVTNSTLRALATLYKPHAGHGARWINHSGSRLTLGGQTLFVYDNYPMQQFIPLINEVGAEVRKTGTNFSRVEWRLSGQGAVTVEQGRLQFSYPQEINGPMTVQAGAALRFDHSAEDLIIGGDATFNGEGRLEFNGDIERVFVNAPTVVNCVTSLTNGIFQGESMLFTRPTEWKGTAWNNPVQFMLGGSGLGTISNSMINFGPMLDKGIASVPGTWALNLSYYSSSNSFPGSFQLQGTNQNRYGWFTNSVGATLHFLQGNPLPSIKWNVHNEGVVRFDSGTKPRFPGSFTQGFSGTTELSGQLIGVQSHLVLDGYVTGWGSITSHNVRVTGTLSPRNTNSPFGRLELRADNSIFTAFPTNRITVEPTTVFEVDLGNPGTGITNDYFLISGPNVSRAGTVNVRAQEGFGPGTYTFFNSTIANLQFGSVPPGYRYSFGTNGNQLTIVVTQPPLPTVSIQPTYNGIGGVDLILNTFSNATYQVDYTDDLAQPWQPWTNFIGNGGQFILPVVTNSPLRFFRVTED